MEGAAADDAARRAEAQRAAAAREAAALRAEEAAKMQRAGAMVAEHQGDEEEDEGSGASGGDGLRKRGRRNRIHPRNWGFTTYIDRVFGMRCFEDLVRLRVFPDAKDISESYGVLQAAIRQGLLVQCGGGISARQAERRQGVLCISIGDGATARTACLASFLTSWHTVSIDPMLRPEWDCPNPHGVARLRGVRSKFEDFMLQADTLAEIRAEVAAAAAAAATGAAEAAASAAAVVCGEENEARRKHEDEQQCEYCGASDHCTEECTMAIDPAAALALCRAQRADWVAWLHEDPDGGRLRYGPVEGKGAFLDPRKYSEECRRAFYVEWRRRARDDAATATSARARESVGAVQQLLLLCVHAHHRFVGNAAISEVRRAFGDPPTTVVALPCCASFNPTKDIGRPPDVRFEDMAIFSACREVLVWRW